MTVMTVRLRRRRLTAISPLAFLAALAAVAEDRGRHEAPSWSDVADLLVAASGYE